MARTTDELLAQLERLLPGYYQAAEPLLAAFAAALSEAEGATDILRPLATIGGGTGKWLTLQGHGIGVLRASGESDESLRTRIRYVEDQVTRSAIENAVNGIIAPDTCQIVEWWDQPYLDDESETGAWLDNQSLLLSGGPQSFIVLIPPQSTGFSFGAFLNADLWLDSEFIGEATEDPAYAAIINDVERLRAAGVFWRLVLET